MLKGQFIKYCRVGNWFAYFGMLVMVFSHPLFSLFILMVIPNHIITKE